MASSFVELDRAELLELCKLPNDSVDGSPRSCKTINLKEFDIVNEQGNCYSASLNEWEPAPDLPLSQAVLYAYTTLDIAVLHDGNEYMVLVKKYPICRQATLSP